MPIVLRYVGGGSFFMHVPARDLTADDVQRCPYSLEELAASDLYEEVVGATPAGMPRTRAEMHEDDAGDCAACE